MLRVVLVRLRCWGGAPMKAALPRERPARAAEWKRGLVSRNGANSKRLLCAITLRISSRGSFRHIAEITVLGDRAEGRPSAWAAVSRPLTSSGLPLESACSPDCGGMGSYPIRSSMDRHPPSGGSYDMLPVVISGSQRVRSRLRPPLPWCQLLGKQPRTYEYELKIATP